MDLTLPGEKPVAAQISAMESKYQYRRRNTFRRSSFCRRRNEPISSSMSRHSAPDSARSVPETQSPSSSKERTAAGPRLAAEQYSYFFRARFRVMRPMKAEKMVGFWSGMAFQTARYVSLTHSSPSSRLARMFPAMRAHSPPYFREVSRMAASSRVQYSAMILSSSVWVLLLCRFSESCFHRISTVFPAVGRRFSEKILPLGGAKGKGERERIKNTPESVDSGAF